MNERARHTKVLDFSLLDEPIASDPALRVSGVQARAERVAVDSRPLPLISIGAPADLSLLEPTYAYLSAYCSACLEPRVAQRLNVAIYELYGNALRYGSAAGEVRFELEREAHGVRVTVSNHADPAQLDRLTAHVARVQADPDAAFDGEMNRIAGASQPPPMVGLVRIAHECSLPIELSVVGTRVVLSTFCDE